MALEAHAFDALEHGGEVDGAFPWLQILLDMATAIGKPDLVAAFKIQSIQKGVVTSWLQIRPTLGTN